MAKINLMASKPKRRNIGTTTFSEKFENQPLVKNVAHHESAQHRLEFDKSGQRIPFGHAPEAVPRVAAKSGAIFSLTGGYVPTFSENWADPGYFYKQHAGGMIMHQEALTFNGPQGSFMRGNHVWYNYAKDYAKAIENVSDVIPGDNPKEKTDNLLSKNSAYNEIMTSYASGVGQYSTALLTNWRNMIAGMMGKKLPEIAEEGRTDMDTFIESEVDRPGQAPEEMIPAILQKMGYNIEVLTDSDDMMKTYGGANPIDIMFKVGSSFYRVDVTQSRIMHKGTHMSIGKFKSSIDFSKEVSEQQINEVLQPELISHYEDSVAQVNAMIQDLFLVVQKMYGKSKVDESFNAVRELIRDMQKGGTGFTRMDASGAQTGKTGDALRGSDIQDFIKNNLGRFEEMAINAAGEEIKRVAIKDAFEHALHVLGADFSALTGDGFFDAVILGKDPNAEMLVKPQFALLDDEPGTTIPQLFLRSVQIEQDHTLFMDWFMQFELGMDADMRQYVIQLANMMWNMDSMYTNLEQIVYGQAMVPTTLLPTAMGYQVAGGAVAFEASSVNAELGAAIQELIEETVDKPGMMEGKAQQVVRQGYQEGRAFSNVWKDGNGFDHSIFSASYEGFNPRNKEIGDMFIQGDENKADEYKGLNTWLRANTWVAPYVGVFYQGGRSQKMEVMGANPKN